MKSTFELALLLLLLGTGFSPGQEAAKSPLKGSVALLGDGFLERSQQGGRFEAILQLGAKDGANLRLTNLAWSGDTVQGHGRSNHPLPKDGMAKLEEQFRELDPSTVILCYGTQLAFSQNPSEHGKALENFRTGLISLVEKLRAWSGGEGPRVILMSPPILESVGSPFPDLSEQNDRLAAVAKIVGEIATETESEYFDLHGALQTAGGGLTSDGIQYTQLGYAKAAEAIVRAFGAGVLDTSQVSQELLSTIARKDRLNFRRWRPTNITYLYGFRSHEQGRNAAEIPQFDPLIEEANKAIQVARLRILSQPRP